MSDEDRLPEEPPAERGTDGMPPGADDEAQQREQGPEEDDPARGLLGEDDDLSVRDLDLVEPGLGEAELGALELGDIAEDGPSALDESGTQDGDESHAAAEELEEDADLVAGSEPVELPGATDDLFPQEEDGESVRDGGEEGLVEDLVDAIDDQVRSGDVAWRQSGPPDEADALGGEFEFSGTLGGTVGAPGLPIGRVATAWPVVVLACRDGRLAGLGALPAEEDGLRLVALDPPGGPVPGLPPLAFGGEAQRVTGLVSSGSSWHVATDRGMVFTARPGDTEWVVADRYAGPGGAPQSWLPLGVSRRAFELLGSRVFPGRVWAWRPGGPLLRWEAGGGWALDDDVRTLRALTEDAASGRTLVFTADEEEAAVLRSFGPGGSSELRSLPGDATDVLLAPGAQAAAVGGTVWLGCRDPELPLLRGVPEAGSWAPVAGVRAVRLVAALPGDVGALAVRTNPADETDELVRLAAAAGPPRLLARARELTGEAPPGPVEGSRDRIDELVVDEAGATVWLRSAGRVYAVALGGGGGGT
ncbi:MAG: hypothetical protein JXB32_14925 [Deltaproteobacteria bacterium]|nr:hypothetical protein [Deltaproteobacteria bacterium]